MRERAWQVNADPECARLRERVRDLESALRPFVAALGYESGTGTGGRWCAPRVTSEQMAHAHAALEGAGAGPS